MRNGFPGFPLIKLILGAILMLILGLLCLTLLVWMFYQGVSDRSWVKWLLFIFLAIPVVGGLGGLILLTGILMLRDTIGDLRAGASKMAGTVTSKQEVVENEGYETENTYHAIWVQGRAFRVSVNIYLWVKEGDQVVVSHWPRSETVIRVDKGLPEPVESPSDTFAGQ